MLFIPQVMLSVQMRPKVTIVVEKVVLQRRLKLSQNYTKVIAPLLILTKSGIYSALHFSYVVITRTQSKGGVRGTDGKAESNASRPNRALARSQKALKDQAGKKGIVLFLPPCFNAHPLVYLLAVVTGTECDVHAEEEAAETELDLIPVGGWNEETASH